MAGFKPKLNLPYMEWPPADRLCWERAFADDGDPFSDARGARLAKSSQHQYLMGWRRFLGFLVIEEPDALELAPQVRLNADRVRRFVSHLARTNIPRSIAIQVDALYKAARIMMPVVDLIWLKNMKARLHAAAPAAGATGPVITSVQLLELGLKLMDENLPLPGEPIRMADAVRYRDGLIIALVAFDPIRRRNITAIKIGRELIREGDRWLLVFPRRETKTGLPIEFEVPESLDEYLQIYLTVIRPRLLGAGKSDSLWVSGKRKSLSYAAVGQVLPRHSSRRMGMRIPIHDVRDAAATTWAIAAPDRIEVASDLLGQADPRTREKHYSRARGIEASRTHSKLIARIRKGTAHKFPNS
jgi:integrase/recombinase XerD